MISASQLKIETEIKDIYNVLIKYGFPGLVTSNFLQSVQDIEKILQDYFQPTIKRQNIIEWLILNINTLYAQEISSKTNKKRKILNNLWKLGILPFSKHSINLDYQKYVQGLLGYQNSINLIYNLCNLLKQSKQYHKSKQDEKFGLFLQEIICNYENLVNLDYDPYKVSFPPAYQNLTDEEFNKEYEEVSRKLDQLKAESRTENKELQVKVKVEDILQDFEQKKTQFTQKYSKLIQKIQETISNNSNLIQNYSQIEISASRTLKVSENLPKIYREYKQKIKLAPILISKLVQERRTVQTLLQSLNQNVCL